MTDLKAKFDKYLELLPTVQDGSGFVEFQTYDSLLWSGLTGCAPGTKVQLDKARLGNLWFRRPIGYTDEGVGPGYLRTLWQRIVDCIKLRTLNPQALAAEFERGSATISRDMLIGVLWYAWANKRLDIAEGIVQYALAHWGIMGKGSPTKIEIMPPLLATAAWVSYRLGGPSRWWLRWIPADFGGTPTDFEAHLQVLHLILRQKATGKKRWWYSYWLKKQVLREPINPLFQLAIGNSETAQKIMSNESYWPSDRLPTTMDRGELWLPQRDFGPDWAPNMAVQPPETHSGGDFLFLYWLLNLE